MTRTATPADVLSGAARWCVAEGDALALLASLSDACVDHVITDPPYDERTHAGLALAVLGVVLCAAGVTRKPTLAPPPAGHSLTPRRDDFPTAEVRP